MRAARTGHLPPFQVFLDEQRDVVYRYLVARVGIAAADDCFQETFLAALRAYPRLPPDASLRAWVLKIAENKAVDHYRARSRAPTPVERVPDRAGTDDGLGDPALWAAVRGLPAKQRAAVLYRFVGDLAYEQVGRLIDSTAEAARQNVREAMKKLRKEWVP